ncbi:MAG: 2-amino-4-hydroxy-6-hydroxymethyldihydropteridine diphosphokinase [Chthoniobacterales bacterium]|nr:2-amino-4-hydroxy-6-hydroxymethyldihydropteridine diphosphokinase [Chthoniobacterales bacterium]
MPCKIKTSVGIALGSNLGKREEILNKAIQELRKIHTSPTFAIRDGDLLQYTQPQNDLLNRLCVTHTPHDFKNHFETKSSQNIIHPNSESRAKSDCSFLVSSFYKTDPINCPPNSPYFINAVVQLETTHPPLLLLKLLQELEIDSGRPALREKNTPRTLDLDLLYYGSTILATPELELPHPRIHERLFVLEPLAEICPDLKLPTWDKTVNEYLLFIKK